MVKCPQCGTVTPVPPPLSSGHSSQRGVLHRVRRTRAESDSRLSGKFNCEALKSRLSVTDQSFDFLQSPKSMERRCCGSILLPRNWPWSFGQAVPVQRSVLSEHCTVFQKPSMSPKVAILRWKRLLVDGVFGRVRAASLPVFPPTRQLKQTRQTAQFLTS